MDPLGLLSIACASNLLSGFRDSSNMRQHILITKDTAGLSTSTKADSDGFLTSPQYSLHIPHSHPLKMDRLVQPAQRRPRFCQLPTIPNPSPSRLTLTRNILASIGPQWFQRLRLHDGCASRSATFPIASCRLRFSLPNSMIVLHSRVLAPLFAFFFRNRSVLVIYPRSRFRSAQRVPCAFSFRSCTP